MEEEVELEKNPFTVAIVKADWANILSRYCIEGKKIGRNRPFAYFKNVSHSLPNAKGKAEIN